MQVETPFILISNKIENSARIKESTWNVVSGSSFASRPTDPSRNVGKEERISR
jgi:hypothetical protein